MPLWGFGSMVLWHPVAVWRLVANRRIFLYHPIMFCHVRKVVVLPSLAYGALHGDLDYGRFPFAVKHGVKPWGKTNYPVWRYVDGGVQESHCPDKWYCDVNVLPLPRPAFFLILAA